MSSRIIVVWLTVITVLLAVLLYSTCLTYSQFKTSETLSKGHDTELFLDQVADVLYRIEGHKNKIYFMELYMNHTSKGDYLKKRDNRPWLREDWNEK